MNKRMDRVRTGDFSLTRCLAAWCLIYLSVANGATAQATSQQDFSGAPVVEAFARLASATYADSQHAAEEMRRAIEGFLDHPSADSLQNARAGWVKAHRAYGQTEAFRFFGGPIDDSRALEKRINTWPIDAAYLDYIQTDASAGLINHAERDGSSGITLSAEGLTKINQRDSERNVSVGFHAIEFLLWGEDLSATGPGDRPYTDYVVGKGKNAERRRKVLRAITALLVNDLQTVRDDWSTEPGHFGAKFIKDPGALRSALIGFTTLAGAELAGERLSTALNTQSQEEEQSCFSDTTTNDINANVAALEMVWTGRYRRRDGTLLEGPGLRGAIQHANAEVTNRLDAALEQAKSAAEALHSPFDQEIVASNPQGQARVARLIEALELVADLGKQAIRSLPKAAPPAHKR